MDKSEVMGAIVIGVVVLCLLVIAITNTVMVFQTCAA